MFHDNRLLLELVKEISRGLYGIVWKALHKNDTVDVKMYPPQVTILINFFFL